MSAWRPGVLVWPRFSVGSRRGVAATTALAIALLAPLGAASQRPPVAHAAADSGTLIVVTDGSAGDIDPATNEAASSDMIAHNIGDTLVVYKGAAIDQFVPALASGWTTNRDRSVYTFTLRRGVRFHTGRTMTAADVQYSLARTVTSGLTNSYLLARFITNPAKQIVVTGPYTVQFRLGRAQPLFLGAVANEYVTLILDSTELKKHATKADPWAHTWASEHDAGTGPYTLKEWLHGQQITLTRFPAYWRGWNSPHFSTVIIRTVPEAATRRELLEKNAAQLTFGLTPTDYDALRSNPGVRVRVDYGTEVDYIAMTQSGPLASPLARQALSYAFNYDAFINAFYHGYAHRAYGPISSVLLGYDAHTFHYQTDLNKARALLQQAGVKPGTTLTYTYSGAPQGAGQILAAQLAQVGIVVKLRHLDEAAFNDIFFSNTAPDKRPNLMPYEWWPDYNDPYDMTVPLIYSKSAGAAGVNAGYYHNKQVDTLLERMRQGDRASLIRDAKTLQDITGRQDPPALWIAAPANVTVMRKDIKGFEFNPTILQVYTFYDLYR